MAEIPLFPLGMVMLPGGRSLLNIFEQRYLRMVSNCMREDTGFGVVMIESGPEVLEGLESGAQPEVETIGSYVKVTDFFEGNVGSLRITIDAEVKIRVLKNWDAADRLMMGQVEFLPLEEDQPVPEEYAHLADLLGHLLKHPNIRPLFEAFDFNSACAVGGRLTEYLPCSAPVKQGLLEMSDPIERLLQLDRIIAELQARGGG